MSAGTSTWPASWVTSGSGTALTTRDTSTPSSRCAPSTGCELLCITGNHENWDRLDALWAEPRWQDEDGTLLPIAVRDHVTMLPRGFRWELGGRSFVALGSAPSVNRNLLTEGVDWWPTEVLREEHVEATIAGGHAEVMLTHDSPDRPYCTARVADIMAGQPDGLAR